MDVPRDEVKPCMAPIAASVCAGDASESCEAAAMSINKSWSRREWGGGKEITIAFTPDSVEIPWAWEPHEGRVDPLSATLRTEFPGAARGGKRMLTVPQAKAIFKSVFRERIEPIVSGDHGYLRFRFIEDASAAHIRIQLGGRGCWSYIGTSALHHTRGSTMGFDRYTIRTIIHECLHMLGMYHEHKNRCGRGDDMCFTFDEANITAYLRENQGWSTSQIHHNVLSELQNAHTTSFDPDSIMLYYFPGRWWNEGRWKRLVDLRRDRGPGDCDPAVDDPGAADYCVGLQANHRLSGIDIAFLLQRYAADPSTVATDQKTAASVATVAAAFGYDVRVDPSDIGRWVPQHDDVSRAPGRLAPRTVGLIAGTASVAVVAMIAALVVLLTRRRR